MMSNQEIYMDLGYVGSAILTVRLIPQIFHTYKTKKVDDIHMLYLILDFMLSGTMLAYSAGMYFDVHNIGTLPIIFGNVAATTCSVIMLIFKAIYSKKTHYNSIPHSIPNSIPNSITNSIPNSITNSIPNTPTLNYNQNDFSKKYYQRD
jgi:uncharacterized protein with PQ loop repeat